MRETKSGKRLLPLVQLLPAVAVAGLVLVTVPRTAPVLAAVPERLAEAASEPAAEPAASSEEEAEGLTAVLPYADGVYTGSSRGFGGTVQVQVTMEGGHITDVQVLSAAHETSAFLPPLVSYFVPFGYYIPLSAYEVANWDQASHLVTYGTRAHNWGLLAFTILLGIGLFAAAWRKVQTEEV